MPRPLMNVVSAQQQILSALERENRVLRLQLAYVARVAGISEQFAAIRKECDADNPAQPVPNPPSQAPSESTEETLKPKGMDNPNTPGQTPGVNDGVAADATTTPMEVGTTIPTKPWSDLEDVTAPVSGTETHVPNEQTRIETDVRVGDPMKGDTAFPLNPNFGDTNRQRPAGKPSSGEMSQTGSRSRTMAAFRLAKMRQAAGTGGGEDEFSIVASIESNNHMTEAMINAEISTLASVIEAQRTRQARPANLVPKAAAKSGNAPVSLQSTASASSDGNDDEDIFL